MICLSLQHCLAALNNKDFIYNLFLQQKVNLFSFSGQLPTEGTLRLSATRPAVLSWFLVCGEQCWKSVCVWNHSLVANLRPTDRLNRLILPTRHTNTLFSTECLQRTQTIVFCFFPYSWKKEFRVQPNSEISSNSTITNCRSLIEFEVKLKCIRGNLLAIVLFTVCVLLCVNTVPLVLLFLFFFTGFTVHYRLYRCW